MDIKGHNYIIEIIKLLCAFGVVWIHFGKPCVITEFCVPIFVAISGYYSKNVIDSKGTSELKRRVMRIVIPFWIWSSIAVVVALLHGKHLLIQEIMLQYVLGHSVYMPLYFLPVIIMCTLAAFLVRWFSGRYWRYVSLVVVLCCLFLQYSGALPYIFNDVGASISYPLARFFAFMPLFVCGYALNYWQKIKTIPSRYFYSGMLLLAAIVVVLRITKILHRPNGFGYEGVDVLILSVMVVFIAVCAGDALACIWRLRWSCGLSAGIYYMHGIVGSEIAKVFDLPHGLLLAIVVFGISALLTFAFKSFKMTSIIVK